MAGIVHAIETQYAGCRFRSRLEARWAVFFDAVGIPWRYEEQGYSHNGQSYLPDFRIYRKKLTTGAEVPTDLFVEVKGDAESLSRDWSKQADLHDFGGCLPGFAGSFGSHPVAGLLLLGDIPRADGQSTHFHPIIQHHKGLIRSWVFFTGVSWEPSCVSVESALTSLLDLPVDHSVESSGDGWLVETRSRRLDRYIPVVDEAYRAARQARFEHGEAP